MKAKVLFVCVENSCRSQMAEAFARKLGENVLEAWSAGSKPSGKINETAIAVMKEKSVDLGLQLSKGFLDLPQLRWDYVITMGCGEQCPFILAQKNLDWKIPDPKNLPLEEFREIRDQIEEEVLELIHSIALIHP